jgi:hypothetical protein
MPNTTSIKDELLKFSDMDNMKNADEMEGFKKAAILANNKFQAYKDQTVSKCKGNKWAINMKSAGGKYNPRPAEESHTLEYWDGFNQGLDTAINIIKEQKENL